MQPAQEVVLHSITIGGRIQVMETRLTVEATSLHQDQMTGGVEMISGGQISLHRDLNHSCKPNPFHNYSDYLHLISDLYCIGKGEEAL